MLSVHASNCRKSLEVELVGQLLSVVALLFLRLRFR